jgi:endonuclease YncB( thermonuclease family)
MKPLAIAGAAALTLIAWQAGAQESCKLGAIGTGQVAAVRDGRTLVLADGRELRLAAIEVTDESRAALQALAGSGALRLEGASADHDRYGRLIVFAYVGDSRGSVQQALLEQGKARVSARVGNKACAGALLAAERTARASRRGLWADPNFAPLAPENHARLRAQRGHFTLIEGKVLSVRESGGTIYMNFGRRWTRDFGVVILRCNQRSFAAAGIAPQQLQGRRIRVRGFLEQRRGPVIEADAPEQIEFADETMNHAQEMRP